MEEKKRATGMMIHGFAVAHALTAGVLAQTLVGDEAALTALTVAMIIAVAKVNGVKWGSGAALSFFGLFVGGYMSLRGTAFLFKWIPGIGNVANAGLTFTSTEIVGWAVYLFIKKGKTDPQSITKEEKKALWNEAKDMREKEEDESRRLYHSMGEADEEEYKSIMKQLRSKELTEEQRDELVERLADIAGSSALLHSAWLWRPS